MGAAGPFRTARRWVALLAVAGACHVGPDYARPAYDVPEAHRGDVEPAAPGVPVMGDLRWFEMFHDDALRELIRIAVAENYDARLAAERIEEARALWQIARGAELPTVDGAASATYTGLSRNGIPPFPTGDRDGMQYALGGSFSWELDFWGRLDRATEAARAEMLSAEENRRDRKSVV